MYVRSKIIFHKKIFGENKYDFFFKCCSTIRSINVDPNFFKITKVSLSNLITKIFFKSIALTYRIFSLIYDTQNMENILKI